MSGCKHSLWKVLSAALALFVTCMCMSSAAAESPVAGPLNGHFYELVEAEAGVDWFEAKSAAEGKEHSGMRGYLAAITTAEEQAFVTSTFPQIEPEYVWLGGTDEESEGFFEWITGEGHIGYAGGFEAWDLGEPNGGADENCLDFADDSIGWNDESCSRVLNFYLVEYSAPILQTLTCRGSGAISPFPEANPVAVIPRVSIIRGDDDLCEPSSSTSVLFDENTVYLSDVPKYFNAAASTDPDFEAFVSAATSLDYEGCVEVFIGQDVIEELGNMLSGGGGCGVGPFDIGDQTVDRIELLVGAGTDAIYVPESRTLRLFDDLTVNFYGPASLTITVEVDFRPFDTQNVINPRSKGRFWAAILSDEEFDALQVDPATVAFGQGEASPERYRIKDVNRDHLPDLMLRFRTPQVALQCGDTELELTGETYAGDSIVGSDAVKTVGCTKPKPERKGKKR